MNKDSKIYVAGHNGLVGSAIVRRLKQEGYSNLIVRTSKELDLTDLNVTLDFFKKENPEYVFLAAAKVGGILANRDYPADFIFKNLSIQTNVIESSRQVGVKKLLFLGSSCIYPKFAQQPIKEEYLLEGKLEETNEPYAIAKIAGIKLCQSYNRQFGTNFISVMPTNLFGINDNFDLNSSHVLPALIRKMHDAKENNSPNVTLWGTGSPKREFLYVEDLAEALIFLMNNYNESDWVNIGTGEDISIKELAELVKRIVGYEGELVWDTSKPDGTPRKLLDVSKINNLGWKHKTTLEDGVKNTYEWYLEKNSNKSNPKLSVVMPAYNAEKYLSGAIESILNQTFEDFEFIIIDDCSTDSTWEILQEYADKDNRIFCLKNEENLGIAGNLNKCLEFCKGDFIARMDSDDWSYPDRFEKQLKFLESNPEVGIVGGSIEVTDSNLSEIKFIRKYFEDDVKLKQHLFIQSPFAHPCIMFRKEVFKGQFYNKILSPTEDYDIYFRIGKNYKFANLEDVLLKYRLHSEQSSTIKAKRQQLLTLYIRIKAFVEYGYTPNAYDIIFSLLQLGSVILLPQKIKFFLFNLIRKR
jgi:GDP-L-fucose synthase